MQFSALEDASTLATAGDGNIITDLGGIPGLNLARAALTPKAAHRIVSGLVSEEWQNWNLKYRAFSRQDFGHYYDIGARSASRPAPPIPGPIRELFPALRAAGWEGPDPTQCIVTLYPPGGALRWHIDNPAFGPTIAGVSLEAEWPIEFSPKGGSKTRDTRAMPLPVLSAYVMKDGARTEWFHQVPRQYGRARISLTFRTMLDDHEDDDG